MNKIEIQKDLFMVEENKYGDKYREHLLEQYKLYVESANKISDRRQKNNDFFFTINTFLLAIFGFISRQVENKPTFMIALVSIAGILVCYFWYRIIRSYKDINTGKFKVIHLIESKLPLALFDAEWNVLGKGQNQKLYLPFTHIEMKIPWVFIVFYLIVFLWNMPWAGIISFFCGICK